ncbi:ATP-dependent helicase/nuclease subunit [Wolffia australiana]
MPSEIRVSPPRSVRWGYIRIISGTILGGILGFYVMHNLETAYKEKMKERLAVYEQEMLKKKTEEDLTP